MQSADGVEQALAALARRKRWVYQVGILLVVGVIVANWINREPDEFVITYIYPVTGVVYLALIPLLHAERIPLHRVEVALFTFGGAAVMLGMVDLLFLSDSLEGALLELTGAQYWAFATLLVFGFVMFDRRQGQWLAAGLYASSLGLAAVAMLREALRGSLTAVPVIYLLRMHVFLAAMLLLVVLVASLREQLHRALERAQLLGTRALTDPLTGTANRYAAEERLATELADAKRRSRPLSVAMVDIDHFKQINDTHGHDVGDAALIAVTRILAAQLRPRDLVARWGGEEFLLLLPEADLDAGLEVAERCRRALEDARPAGLEVTATFGVAQLGVGESARGAVRRADVALYDGKHAGRNRVVGSAQPRVVS